MWDQQNPKNTGMLLFVLLPTVVHHLALFLPAPAQNHKILELKGIPQKYERYK
jgi:hypothetical protein